MPTVRRTKSTPAGAQHDRTLDIIGVILASLGLLMGFALAMGNAGLLGEALSGIFLTLFGRGAWAMPVLLILIGCSLVFGRRQLSISSMTTGLLLLFLTFVGILGARVQGDLFDPERVMSNGGYVGAVVAWFFSLIMGNARGIGLACLGLIGVIFCVNQPLREYLSRIPRPKVASRDPEDEPAGRSKSVRRALEEDTDEGDEKRNRLRAAIVRMGDRVLDAHGQSEDMGEPEHVPAQPKPERKSPVVRDTEALTPLAFSSAQTSKEGYDLPSTSLLNEPQAVQKRSPEEMRRNIETIEGTLDQFGIEANVVEVATGPSITRYEIQLGPGVRVNRITNLADNLAMDLAASHVRVEAPIPGKAAIGVEVPNAAPSMVTLRQCCEQKDFLNHNSRLYVALGQDVSGVHRYCDLTKMPHLLIAGATNSGKSIGLATIISSLLLRNTPKDLRMVMIDPKRVELSLFDGIPHLMCPVVKDVKEAPGVLRAVWREMDNRYDRFSEVGVRNIDGWNEKASFAEKLPYIVVIIDELADLMIQAAAEVETSIVRIAQLARAVGIHLVIATQRPSADVITGTIKANIPSRIAFAVAGSIDSRIILDQVGAERLVGKGDMLYMPIDASKPTRIQGCYVSEKEIERICKHWRDQEKPHYVLNPIEVAIADRTAELQEQSESDPLWEEAVQWVVDKQQASTSMLQRRFSIGFQRASRLLDMMEERGIVGPRDGARPREVLLDPMQATQLFGRGYRDVDVTIDPLD